MSMNLGKLLWSHRPVGKPREMKIRYFDENQQHSLRDNVDESEPVDLHRELIVVFCIEGYFAYL